jgi:hypothetical protein
MPVCIKGAEQCVVVLAVQEMWRFLGLLGEGHACLSPITAYFDGVGPHLPMELFALERDFCRWFARTSVATSNTLPSWAVLPRVNTKP